MSLVKSLNDLTEDNIDYEMSPGKVDVHYGDLSEAGKLLVESFFIGICLIANEYPDNVRVA
nr:MAG TPA: YsxB-like protein [Caudoviricetes sp.]